MRILSTAMVFIMTIGAAAAETVCYERLYDAAHMQKHKLQEVTKIRLKLEDNGEEFSGDIQAGFRELPDYLTSDVTCTEKQKTTSCQVDQNGGSFDFVPTAKGIRLTNTSQIRFGGIDDGVVIGREEEHRVFALVKTACNN
jgi:hypothetical protein